MRVPSVASERTAPPVTAPFHRRAPVESKAANPAAAPELTVVKLPPT
jgi:hypothetical protein